VYYRLLIDVFRGGFFFLFWGCWGVVESFSLVFFSVLGGGLCVCLVGVGGWVFFGWGFVLLVVSFFCLGRCFVCFVWGCVVFVLGPGFFFVLFLWGWVLFPPVFDFFFFFPRQGM